MILVRDKLGVSERRACKVLEAVNIAAVKPATVRRTWAGTDYTFDCYVSQHVKDEYQARNIVIGDYVLFEVLDGTRIKWESLPKYTKPGSECEEI